MKYRNDLDTEKFIKSILQKNLIFLDLCGSDEERLDKITNEVIKYYSQPHRFYHTLKHVSFLLDLVENTIVRNDQTKYDIEILQIVSIFHDIVYYPDRKNNEEDSVQIFLSSITPESKEKHKNTINLISEIIMDTKNHKGNHILSKTFSEFDLFPLLGITTIQEVTEYERSIFKEFQMYDYVTYRNKRISFLSKFDTISSRMIQEYVKSYTPKIGIYAGSFNPFHKGHNNILEKAEKIFDKIIVAIGNNPDKDQKDNQLVLKAIKDSIPYRQVELFDGLLTRYISNKQCMSDITLIRGLRNGFDFAYEQNQLRFLQEMYPELKVIYIPCDKEYEHISSSAIRNIQKIDYEMSKRYL